MLNANVKLYAMEMVENLVTKKPASVPLQTLITLYFQLPVVKLHLAYTKLTLHFGF